MNFEEPEKVIGIYHNPVLKSANEIEIIEMLQYKVEKL